MKPTSFQEISHEDYRQDPAVSQSLLKEVLRSPAHAHYAMTTPKEQTPAMQDGEAAHLGLFQLDDFGKHYEVCDYRGGTKAYKQWVEAHPGVVPLPRERYERILGMMDAVIAHPVAVSLIDGGWAEQSIFWDHQGIPCKGRPDYYRDDGIVLDLKTTADASPEGFRRAIANFRYHLQAAFYTDGLRACEVPVRAFVFIAVENKPPHGVGVYTINDQALKIGRAQYQRAIARLALCRHLNRWPSYTEDIIELDLPRYAK